MMTIQRRTGSFPEKTCWKAHYSQKRGRRSEKIRSESTSYHHHGFQNAVDGWDYHELKIRDKDDRVAIIVTTAFSDVEMVIKAIDMGINKYILKPVVASELMETLNDCAVKALISKEGKLPVGEQLVLDIEEKKEMEKTIQNRLAMFLKR